MAQLGAKQGRGCPPSRGALAVPKIKLCLRGVVSSLPPWDWSTKKSPVLVLGLALQEGVIWQRGPVAPGGISVIPGTGVHSH